MTKTLHDRTAEIIMVCKNHLDEESQQLVKSQEITLFEQLRLYLSIYGGVAIENISDYNIKFTLCCVFTECVECCEDRAALLGEFFKKLDNNTDIVDAYISSLRALEIRDSEGNYTNGFNAENAQPVSLLNFYHSDEEFEVAD